MSGVFVLWMVVFKPGGSAAMSVWGRKENSPKMTIVPETLKKFGIETPSRRTNFHLVSIPSLNKIADLYLYIILNVLLKQKIL
jgi:hypothetical protein